MLVDSHCHLDFPDFDEDRDAVVARARAAGVGVMVTISTRVRAFPTLKALAASYERIYCSVGTHPHHADEELDVTADDLARIASDPIVVAIGEAGLDYHYDNAPRAAQAEGFRRHIAAARKTQLPLVIHAREADDDIATILADEMGQGAFPAILHCFSSGPELARRGIELGTTLQLCFQPRSAPLRQAQPDAGRLLWSDPLHAYPAAHARFPCDNRCRSSPSSRPSECWATARRPCAVKSMEW